MTNLNGANLSDISTIRDLVAWERDLVVGDEVDARWTCSYRSYGCRARVVRLNGASVRIELLEAIGSEYAAGRKFSLPRRTAATWSPSNAVYPVGVAA